MRGPHGRDARYNEIEEQIAQLRALANSAAGAGATYVIDPLATPEKNVYADFATAAAAALLVAGHKWFLFRRSYTIPAGAYDVGTDPIDFEGTGDEDVTLTIADGATLQPCNIGWRNFTVDYQGTAVPFTTFTSDALLDANNCVFGASGGVPMYRADGNSAFVDMALLNTAFAGGADVVEGINGGVFEIQEGNNCNIGQNTLSDGGGTGTMTVNQNSLSARIEQVQTGLVSGFARLGIEIVNTNSLEEISPLLLKGLIGLYLGEDYDPTTGTWTDTSGRGNHLTQAAAPNRPTAGAGLDGRPTVAFTDPQYLDLPAGLQRGTAPQVATDGEASTTVYFVVQGTADGVARGLLDPKVGGVYIYANDSATNKWAVFAGAMATSGQSLAAFQVICAAWDQVKANNGIDMYTGTTVPTSGAITANNAGTDGILGADRVPPGGHDLEGEIADWAIFSGRHDPETVTRVMNYFKRRRPSV